jgi:hypothetical protein
MISLNRKWFSQRNSLQIRPRTCTHTILHKIRALVSTLKLTTLNLWVEVYFIVFLTSWALLIFMLQLEGEYFNLILFYLFKFPLKHTSLVYLFGHTYTSLLTFLFGLYFPFLAHDSWDLFSLCCIIK